MFKYWSRSLHGHAEGSRVRGASLRNQQSACHKSCSPAAYSPLVDHGVLSDSITYRLRRSMHAINATSFSTTHWSRSVTPPSRTHQSPPPTPPPLIPVAAHWGRRWTSIHWLTRLSVRRCRWSDSSQFLKHHAPCDDETTRQSVSRSVVLYTSVTLVIMRPVWQTDGQTDVTWPVTSRQYARDIGLSSVLRPRQHSIGYMGDSFTGQKTQPTVSKYWRKKLQRKTQKKKKTQNTHIHTKIVYNKKIHIKSTANPLVHSNMGWLGDGSHRGQGR